jgi:hypothetical protein
MKRLFATLLLIAPLVAGAQTSTPDYNAYSEPPIPQPEGAPPPPPEVTPGPPVVEPPVSQPPAPYVQQMPAPAPAPRPTAAAGQWVYTSQYGWVFMPYGDGYTYLPAGGSAPDMYVYYPAVGWTWVVAPWVWGLGPRPYFGFYGFAHYAWYGRGFGRWYGFAPRYVTWGPRGYWAGGRWTAPHAAYPRVVTRYPSPRMVAPQVPSHVVGPHAAPHAVAPHVVGRGGFGGGHVVAHGGHVGHR